MCENIINSFYKVLKYKFINVILIVFRDGVSAEAKDEILSPSPNPYRGNFLLHSHLHGKKFSNFRSPNGAISAEIPIYG
jgi:hypothetical protein